MRTRRPSRQLHSTQGRVPQADAPKHCVWELGILTCYGHWIVKWAVVYNLENFNSVSSSVEPVHCAATFLFLGVIGSSRQPQTLPRLTLDQNIHRPQPGHPLSEPASPPHTLYRALSIPGSTLSIPLVFLSSQCCVANFSSRAFGVLC